MGDAASVGEVLTLFEPGGVERRVKILEIDRHGESVRVRYIDYAIPDAWVPMRWFK